MHEDDIQQNEQSQDGSAVMRAKMQSIVANLQADADERVGKRSVVEQRWLADLAQYHGKYDDAMYKELSQSKKSTLYINQTRSKTNSAEARLSDMLFPTDDRNWGIQPTPVPELATQAEEAAITAANLKRDAAENPEDPQLRQQADAKQGEHEQMQAIMGEARKKAQAMETEISDHLKECRYSIQARDTIHDACKLGTGVMKGPVIGGRTRRKWEMTPEGSVMVEATDPRPKFWRVDPWAFFPDMDSTTIDDCESVFERHLLNKKELRRLAKEPGFDADAIRRLLGSNPQESTPYYISDLRSITGAYHDASTDRYHVWEYHGPLSAEDMLTLSEVTGDDEIAEYAGISDADVDPLMEIQVSLWFAQGEMLKFGIHHLDSGDQIYSVFNLEKDEASIFGFGVPYLMRDSQSALNAAWRTMLDNAGLSSGPQIVVNRDAIEPANGLWGLEARKIWFRKPGVAPNTPGFEQYPIASMQVELANIAEMAKRNVDDETNMPMIAQGEQGAQVTKTAQGMSLLMNSANIVFRRVVKNWDDDMTTPNIRRMYDFLMQFSQKEHIKGDYEVDARGSSVLLVREMQSSNLMTFLTQFSTHPILGQYLKDGGLPAMKRLVQTMMLPADELLKSEEEIASDAAAAAEQPPEPNPEIMKLEMQANLSEKETQAKFQLAEYNRETEMMKLAAGMNIKIEELRARLGEAKATRASKERIFASEAAMTQRVGPSGGGYL